ncbi:MAG: ATP-binding protein [Candidatus Bathyarchaeia archaeon]
MHLCYACSKEPAEIFIDYSKRRLCINCFLNYYERKVKRTIEAYRMIKPGEKIGVAVSGGKDSTALLYALKKLYPTLNLVAIHLNLGVKEYSDHCNEILRNFIKKIGVPLIEFNLIEKLGFSIHNFEKTRHGKKICSICGTIKRYLLNKIAYENKLNKLATGHNLDDIVEVIFNCYIQGDTIQLARVNPVLPGTHSKLVARIKPLCMMSEAEDLFYASYTELPFRSLSCPLSKGNRSLKNKKFINTVIMKEMPTFKHMLFKSYVKRISPYLKPPPEKIFECEICGMPTSKNICAFCRLTKIIKPLQQ